MAEPNQNRHSQEDNDTLHEHISETIETETHTRNVGRHTDVTERRWFDPRGWERRNQIGGGLLALGLIGALAWYTITGKKDETLQTPAPDTSIVTISEYASIKDRLKNTIAMPSESLCYSCHSTPLSQTGIISGLTTTPTDTVTQVQTKDLLQITKELLKSSKIDYDTGRPGPLKQAEKELYNFTKTTEGFTLTPGKNLSSYIDNGSIVGAFSAIDTDGKDGIDTIVNATYKDGKLDFNTGGFDITKDNAGYTGFIVQEKDGVLTYKSSFDNNKAGKYASKAPAPKKETGKEQKPCAPCPESRQTTTIPSAKAETPELPKAPPLVTAPTVTVNPCDYIENIQVKRAIFEDYNFKPKDLEYTWGNGLVQRNTFDLPGSAHLNVKLTEEGSNLYEVNIKKQKDSGVFTEKLYLGRSIQTETDKDYLGRDIGDKVTESWSPISAKKAEKWRKENPDDIKTDINGTSILGYDLHKGWIVGVTSADTPIYITMDDKRTEKDEGYVCAVGNAHRTNTARVIGGVGFLAAGNAAYNHFTAGNASTPIAPVSNGSNGGAIGGDPIIP